MRLPDASTLWLVIGGGAALVVAASMGLGHLLDAPPCHLCIAQRAMLVAVVPLAVLAGLLWRRAVGLGAGMAVAAAAVAGLVVAVHQSWLERQPPEVAASCVGLLQPTPTERLAQTLGDAVPWLFAVEGVCDEIGPTLFGLSFANGGLLVFTAILVAATTLSLRWPAAR
ncbi:MAG: disulfide bond formation protein B [Pseudomonadota bacterium]